jgi:hypothetical protein
MKQIDPDRAGDVGLAGAGRWGEDSQHRAVAPALKNAF